MERDGKLETLTQVGEKKAHILAENEASSKNPISASSALVFLILLKLYTLLDLKNQAVLQGEENDVHQLFHP